MAGKFVTLLDEYFYRDFSGNWDDQMLRERILRSITKDDVLLDLGAGAGIVKQMNFKDLAAKVCGIDLDTRVKDNPYLDEAHVSDAREIPYADSTFDVVFADNVMEHLDAPSDVLSEIYRVLKPGGILLFKTPNKFHYMPIISRLTPLGFHRWFNRLRRRKEIDTFPTRYLLNSEVETNVLGANAGFEIKRVELIEGRPEYLRFSVLTYLIGICYERLVNSTRALRNFRILLIAELQKPSN